MTRIVRLDEHVSRVQSSVLELLDSPGCSLLVLSDVQVAVLAQMTFPYAWWDTRLVVDHGTYQETVEFPQEYKDELECLELLLSGGATMTCDLSVVLAELADAIRNQSAGAGSCAYTGPSAVLNCLPGMTPGELIPQVPTDAPEYGVPPVGFDTWEQYLVHKCKAAYAIYDTVYGLFGALALLPILQITVTVVGTALGGYVAGTAFGAAAFPPAAIVAIAALAVAIGLLDAQAYMQFLNIQDYLRAHKEDIVCGLYNSGSASEALAGLAAEVEDAIQSVQWAVIFGGVIGPQLASAVGAMAGEAETNNLVNPLFQVVEDFAYPDVTCCSEQPPSGPDWHFDATAEGWTFSVIENEGDVVEGSWHAGGDLPDPMDSSAGQLRVTIDKPTPPLLGTYGIWTYTFPFGQIPEVVGGDVFSLDTYSSISAAAEITLQILYTDSTYSQLYLPNPGPAWSNHYVAGTPGKFVNALRVLCGVGESDVLHDFRLDQAVWGQ